MFQIKWLFDFEVVDYFTFLNVLQNEKGPVFFITPKQFQMMISSLLNHPSAL